MSIAYILIWGCSLIFGGSAITALMWAIRSGQMTASQEGADSIFDDGEPIGKPTDSFPGARR